MNDLQSTFLILSALLLSYFFCLHLLLFSFWDKFENRCFLTWGFMVLLCLFMKRKLAASGRTWQCFSRLLSHHFSTYFNDHVLSCIPSGVHCLRWLDPVFLGGYHPTLKLSGILTFTFKRHTICVNVNKPSDANACDANVCMRLSYTR